MAACSAQIAVSAGVPSLAVRNKSVRPSSSRVSFSGRNLVHTASISSRSWEAQTKLARSNARTVCADTGLVISLSTGALLFLGSRAQEVSSLLKTNDPAGFTLVDVLAWGALGHAIGFFILATSSNGYDPTF
ncbi:hypothetical protein R1sor_024375 [Riccia sorocarpa]|uniref:PSI-G n=1 Tax=Riccia sorocarpa TaxID=122646 RepID=A0ABD3GSS1_9MARC